MKPFIHLHVHSEFSLLDGACRLVKGKESPLLSACIDKNMPAIAITDHGNMYASFTFYKMAKKKGIKPIIGCEFYTCEDMYAKNGKEELNHLVLLAKNEVGYRNLVKLDSMAFIDGFYYKPRIDLNFLKNHSEGLICLSACLAGKIPRLLMRNNYEAAKQYAITLKNMFAEGDFYIELQDHGIPEQKQTNPLLVQIAREIGVKTVATNDAHYIQREDASLHDVLLCVQTGKTLEDPTRMRFQGEEFYLKNYDEMYEVFSWVPEALETPFEIAEKCNVDIKKQDLIPPYAPEDGSNPDDFLRRITHECIKERYPVITDEITERVNYELDTIIKMGFAEYYLIVWDFIDWAKRHDIPVGAGRGSGVGSIVAYAIGITNVDPLKYSLIFERFLNPERVSMPDFDIDFCFEGRGKVKDYVVEKYGQDKVCEIITFGTMASKAAIKDVARVYRIPFDKVNSLTKEIPNVPKITIDDILGFKDQSKKVNNVVEQYNSDDTIKMILDIARKLEGMPRNCSKHAAGVVICKEVISDFVPLQRNGDDITTQFQKDEVEELGMLKMDFLGLKTLTDIKKAKQYIKEAIGDEIDFQKLGYDDAEVYKLISSGDTDAVFQLESGGMKSFMKQLQPQSLEDIIAGISLYRPGPMDSIPKYIKSKNNASEISYDHPMLEPILDVTYGCLVYQEQVMEVVRTMAGYTFGRADELRRAMGKKKHDVMEAERSVFIHGCEAKNGKPAVDGAVKRGVEQSVAEKIFNDMAAFASYAFNKSHAAAYAVLAYETAFLKRYYPIHFVAAVINNRITFADEIAKYVGYMKDRGFSVLPPDINKSNAYFSVEGEAMRFGLVGVKNVGEQAISAVIDERNKNGEFKSLFDLLSRVGNAMNKRMIESLIMGGAMDCFGETRATLLASYDGILNQVVKNKKIENSGQMTFFNLFVGQSGANTMERLPELNKSELLSNEKAMLSVYLSGHPLDDYRDKLSKQDFNLKFISELTAHDEDDEEALNNADNLRAKLDNTRVTLVGMVTELFKRQTKSGGEMYAGVVEDLYNAIEFVVFPKNFQAASKVLQKDAIVCIQGTLQTEGRLQIMVGSVSSWGKDEADVRSAEVPQQTKAQKVYINAQGFDNEVFLPILKDYNTADGVEVFFQRDKQLFNTGCRINPSNGVMIELRAALGEKNILLK